MPTRTETASFLVIAAATLSLVLLERVRPYNRGQRIFRTGFWTDFVWYNFVQSWALGLVIGRIIGVLDARTSLSRLHLVSAWPIPVQLLFFLVTHDLYIYLFHRWQHASPLLWRIHEAHHSVPEVDWLSGVRSHPLEILINQTVEFAPIVLLGAAPQVPVIKGAISAIWGMYIHSNLDVRTGPLQLVLNGPEMHRWHHASSEEARGKNFATKLAIWDWLFGTAFFPDPAARKASGYGLGRPGFPEGGLMDGYIRQVAWAFRPASRAGG